MGAIQHSIGAFQKAVQQPNGRAARLKPLRPALDLEPLPKPSRFGRMQPTGRSELARRTFLEQRLTCEIEAGPRPIPHFSTSATASEIHSE